MFLLKKRYWLSLTLLLAVVLVLRQLPASWLIYGIQQAVPNLQVSGVSGKLWNGTIDYAQWVERGQTVPLGEVKWQLNWTSFLALKPCVSISARASNQNIKGDGCYGLFDNALELSNADISLPISRIAPYFSVDLDGTIDAFAKKLVWQNQQITAADLSVLWQQAALFNGSVWIKLGDIQGQINDDGNGGVNSNWRHAEGARPAPVAVDLQAQVSELTAARPRVNVSGTVTPTPETAALQPMLQFVGEDVGAGVYRINIRE